ncbi:uncharacterized protein LOC113522960 [Galleria mellonella]|uniref:Uncharacterized protein LOC113522960 n=1 Tax=Galleria mellonella TaxID=7137 RepID=A0A6J1X997_GALME|nr:uncharacterized protein LOC113522960 [Galleria mellonella]
MRELNIIQVCAIVMCCLHLSETQNEVSEIKRIFSACRKKSPDFDTCMKRAFNKLRPYFKVGIPELGVAPFDPHFAREVKRSRNIAGIGFTITLRDVYEEGWTQSLVTKYKTDWNNGRIIYSQYFPVKTLHGDYDFQGEMLGLNVFRSGHWNLTLRDYSQSTRIKRNYGDLDVHVEVDHIGGMELHVGNILKGNGILESILDRIINAAWKPGFAILRPLINDFVSTAFTDIWSKSFKNFTISEFIKD